MDNEFDLARALGQHEEQKSQKKPQDNGTQNSRETIVVGDIPIIMDIIENIPHNLSIHEKKEKYESLLPYLVQFSRSDLDLAEKNCLIFYLFLTITIPGKEENYGYTYYRKY